MPSLTFFTLECPDNKHPRLLHQLILDTEYHLHVSTTVISNTFILACFNLAYLCSKICFYVSYVIPNLPGWRINSSMPDGHSWGNELHYRILYLTYQCLLNCFKWWLIALCVRLLQEAIPSLLSKLWIFGLDRN